MKEKTITKKNIFKGRVVKLDLLKVKLPNGNFAKREIITHPGAVAIVPVLPKKKIVLIRQYRKPIEKNLLEIPAGTLDEKESPLNCAKRELIEETGYKTKYIKKITTIYPAPGYTSECIHIYKATKLIKVGTNLEPDEFIKTEILSFNKIKKLIKQGKIRDAKTLVALRYII